MRIPIIKLLALCAASAAAAPAMAQGGHVYAGIEGGVNYVPDFDIDISAPNNKAGQVNSNYGWDVDGTIGFDFGGFRAEAEVGYRRASVDELTYKVPTPIFTSPGTIGIAPAGSFPNAGGRTSALDFMINGLIDVGKDDELQGFVGGGAGVARVSGKYGLSRYGEYLNDTDTVFAWQVLAGLRAPLSDRLDVTFKYRFFNTARAELVDIDKRPNDLRFRSHSILAGITYNFGAARSQ